jgi:hypothetical protein
MVHTLTCISCSRDLVKIGVRDGDYTAKAKALCPCGGESYITTIKGKFSISPEIGFYVDEIIMPSPSVVNLDIDTNLGVTIFKMKNKKDVS